MQNKKLKYAIGWKIGLVLTAFLILICYSCDSKKKAETESKTEVPVPNALTEAEKEGGWRLLFDGKTFNGWRGLGRDTIPQGHWVIEDETIKKVANEDVLPQADGQPLKGGDLMTVDSFENFEFSFEWKISPGGNSGVKYNVSEELSTSRGSKHSALGFEYQVFDDEGYSDPIRPNQQTGGLYDLIAPQNRKLRPTGQFNQSRILLQGNHGEHWLNGQKVLEYDLVTPLMDSLLIASKFRDISSFADKKTGHIVLQDHSDEVWYRNLKIRMLP